MFTKLEHVQLLDTCRKKSIFLLRSLDTGDFWCIQPDDDTGDM